MNACFLLLLILFFYGPWAFSQIIFCYAVSCAALGQANAFEMALGVLCVCVSESGRDV